MRDVCIPVDNLWYVDFFQQFRRIRDDAAAIDKQAPLVADELGSLFFTRSAGNLSTIENDAVVIRVFDVRGVGCFVPAIRIEGRRAFRTDGATFIHAESPLGDVQMVGTKVGLLTATVIPEEAEQVVHPVFVVETLWCRSQPAVKIKALGRGTVGNRFAGACDPVGAGQRHVHGMHLAQ